MQMQDISLASVMEALDSSVTEQDRSCSVFHKQPSRGTLRKSCSENMQQIYRRTLMLKCTLASVFSCKFAAYFQKRLFLRTPLKGCFWLLVGVTVFKYVNMESVEIANVGIYRKQLKKHWVCVSETKCNILGKEISWNQPRWGECEHGKKTWRCDAFKRIACQGFTLFNHRLELTFQDNKSFKWLIKSLWKLIIFTRIRQKR